jgi:sulfatase maturation enzyme AslB (radical SAM superfamily)
MFDGGNEEVNGRSKREYLQIQKQAPNKIDFIKHTLATSKFESLRFDILGGEPLINPAIFEFLDWLSDQPYSKNIGLSITTNGTTYNEKMVKYLEKFSYVSIQLSIDGIDKEYEYLRFGNDFNTLQEVADKFYLLSEQYNNFNVSSHYTLSWMNCLHFAQYFNWAQTRYPNWIDLYVSKLEEPFVYGIDTLPLKIRTKIVDKVMTELDEPVNEKYTRGLYLYKQHMLSTTHDYFNEELYLEGIKRLRYVGTKRNINIIPIVKDTMDFIEENK